MVQIRKVRPVVFGLEGWWNFYAFFEDYLKRQRTTAKTVEVVGFGDVFLALSIDRYFLKEGSNIKSQKNVLSRHKYRCSKDKSCYRSFIKVFYEGGLLCLKNRKSTVAG